MFLWLAASFLYLRNRVDLADLTGPPSVAGGKLSLASWFLTLLYSLASAAYASPLQIHSISRKHVLPGRLKSHAAQCSSVTMALGCSLQSTAGSYNAALTSSLRWFLALCMHLHLLQMPCRMNAISRKHFCLAVRSHMLRNAWSVQVTCCAAPLCDNGTVQKPDFKLGSHERNSHRAATLVPNTTTITGLSSRQFPSCRFATKHLVWNHILCNARL